jgi:DNA invertase Pin-like site-specific DNA recombinase
MMREDLRTPSSRLISDKIQRRHLERTAMVYIRQSTPQQVERHQESTRLQYALVERARQFGWEAGAIVVVDDDLGRSGTSTEGRPGFQRLVAEVGLGHVGMVLGVEISRLARSCRDWHQLLEICALFDTLIADADGVYDAANFNDRLLLGLKGTMSEAELHILKARMLAGKRAKARRGELGRRVPMGYVQRPSGEIAFDPDEQAQATIRLVFELFERFHTVGRVMRYLVDHDIRMPVRVAGGVHKGELEWHRVNRISLHNLFANPIYAGAYVYGLRPTDPRRRKPGRPSTGRRSCAPEAAEVFLPGQLPAYISWEQYQRNRAQVRSNKPSATGVARAGQSLLSGLLICGRCGRRMLSQYNNNGTYPRYTCARMACDYGDPVCQTLKAAPLDALVERLVLAALEPAALDASVLAAGELQRERAALDAQWQHRLERAAWQAARARRQYDATEPENRLVARTLEREWEQALATQAQLQGEYERFQRDQPRALSEAEIATLRARAGDLPGIWRDATQEERQTLVRLLLERVIVKVVDDSEQVRVVCHWHGGHQTSHQLVRPVARLDQLSTYQQLIGRAADLHRAGHGHAAIAQILNDEGWRPPKRRETFNASMVQRLLRRACVTTSQYKRRQVDIERQSDEWKVAELARHIPLPQATLYNWVQNGRLRSRTVFHGERQYTIVYADAATIAAIRSVRATPVPWRRRPAPVAATEPATTADSSVSSTPTDS